MEPRKRRKGPSGCLIVLLILVLLIAGAAAYAYNYVMNEIEGDRGDEVTTSTFIVERGSGPLTIGKQLQKNGIILQPQIFRYYVGEKGYANNLQYGEFEFSSDMSYEDILAILQTQEERASTRVTIPEGKSLTQTAQIMEDAGLCDADEFIQVANTNDFSKYKFWGYVETNELTFMRGEGYVFPDTYDFFNDDTVYNMVAKFYANFDAKFTSEMYARMDELDMSLNEVITLASMIQEEAGNAESANVSSVFHNRLNSKMMLQSNVSSYVQSDKDNNYVWNIMAPYYGSWEEIPEEMRVAYDTYATVGLPPAPVSNPGLLAIQSALYPNDTNYYYFITDAQGNYFFNETLSGHSKKASELGY